MLIVGSTFSSLKHTFKDIFQVLGSSNLKEAEAYLRVKWVKFMIQKNAKYKYGLFVVSCSHWQDIINNDCKGTMTNLALIRMKCGNLGCPSLDSMMDEQADKKGNIESKISFGN